MAARDSVDTVKQLWDSKTLRILVTVIGIGQAIQRWDGNHVTLSGLGDRIGPIETKVQAFELQANSNALQLELLRDQIARREWVRYHAQDPAGAVAYYDAEIQIGKDNHQTPPTIAMERALAWDTQQASARGRTHPR